MFIDWTVTLLIVMIGGPLAIIVKIWYKKKPADKSSKFADNGTYVRDDSLYSYENTGDTTDKKNNS